MMKIIKSLFVLASVVLPCLALAQTPNAGEVIGEVGERAPATAAAQVPDILQVKSFTLSNGLTVWINEDHTLPKVYGAVVVRAGARDCPDTGIAHYFEHILFKGTDKIGTTDYAAERPWLDSIADRYDLLAQTTDGQRRLKLQRDINRLSLKAAEYAIPNEFNNLISRYGGTGLNAYTSLDETVFHNTFTPQYIAQWAELNSERMLNPVFRLFQGELETVYEEKNMYSDNMIMPAIEAVQRRVCEGTPYEYPVIGSTENLKNPRLSEMRAFFDRYYVASNMGLMLCGDVCADTIVPLLERTFGRLRRGEVPVRQSVSFRPFGRGEQLDIKLPLPLIKMQGRIFRAPKADDPDMVALELALGLLSNDSGTGLLDSLEHSHKVLGVMAGAMDGMFGNDGLVGYGYVPRLPFGSKKKARRLCREQVERLMEGRFDDDALAARKVVMLREAESDLEDIDKRAALMVDAFSRGRSWADVQSRPERIEAVTRADIVRVARQYLGAEGLLLTKRFGTVKKERVSQPGYEPVAPKNAGARSDYAQRLEQMASDSVRPRYIDLNGDARQTELAPMVRLYTVDNPINDLFELQLIYHRGTTADPRLEHVAAYMTELGTDSLTRLQFGRAMQSLGAQLTIDASAADVTVTLRGFDRSFGPSVALLGRLLTSAKADAAKFRDLVSAEKIAERSFFRENTAIAQAVFDRVAYGDRSEYLNRTTVAEMKQMGADSLVGLFRDLLQTEVSIVYSGTLASDSVARIVSSALPLDRVSRPHDDPYRPLLAVTEPVVYVFDNPSARQTIVGTYQQLPAQPSSDDRTHLRLWGRYFGGGMSSLLFQEAREFRSLAYMAMGSTEEPSLSRHADAPVAYQTVVGTQADKTMQALGLLDTLFTDMPMREANLAAVRQSMVNSVCNNRPTFREIGARVARLRLNGYADDPNRAVISALSGLGAADVRGFYDDYVKKAPRVTIVVGDKRRLDMAALARYGKVVELKELDVYRR